VGDPCRLRFVMPQGDIASSGVDSTQARIKPRVESASCLGHQHLLELKQVFWIGKCDFMSHRCLSHVTSQHGLLSKVRQPQNLIMLQSCTIEKTLVPIPPCV
jgi:hypothetical protein